MSATFLSAPRNIDALEALRYGAERFKRHTVLLVGINAICILCARLMNWVVEPSIEKGLFVALNTILEIIMAFIWLKVLLMAEASDDLTWRSVCQRLNWMSLLPFAGVSMAVIMMVLAGFAAFALPGLILLLMFSPAWFLVLDRQLSVIETLKTSIQLTKGYKRGLLRFGVIMVLVMLPGVLPSASSGVLEAGTVIYDLVMAPITGMACLYVYRTLERGHRETQR